MCFITFEAASCTELFRTSPVRLMLVLLRVAYMEPVFGCLDGSLVLPVIAFQDVASVSLTRSERVTVRV